MDASEGDGAREHTTLHECYEIVRERLHDLYPHLGAPRGKTKCRQADRFAAAALMQPYWFSLFAETSGFDVVALHRTYGRAYSSLTIRLAEVMRHQPLLAVLYERGEAGDPREWAADAPPEVFRAKVVARTPGFRLRTRQKTPVQSSRSAAPAGGSAGPGLSSGEGGAERLARLRGAGERVRSVAERRRYGCREASQLAQPAGQGSRRRRTVPGPVRPAAAAWTRPLRAHSARPPGDLTASSFRTSPGYSKSSSINASTVLSAVAVYDSSASVASRSSGRLMRASRRCTDQPTRINAPGHRLVVDSESPGRPEPALLPSAES